MRQSIGWSAAYELYCAIILGTHGSLKVCAAKDTGCSLRRRASASEAVLLFLMVLGFSLYEQKLSTKKGECRATEHAELVEGQAKRVGAGA